MIKSYKELSLDKYSELMNMDLEGREDIDIQVEVISILSDMDEDEVLSLPLTEYSEMVKNTEFLTRMPDKNGKPFKTVKINGREYDILQNPKDMIAGQYIDYNHWVKDSEKINENLPNILSTLLTPKGHKYNDGYDMIETLNDIKQMPVETAFAIAGFFFEKSQRLTRNTLTYLIWQMRIMKLRTKDKIMKEKMTEAIHQMVLLRSLVKSGDGLMPQ